MGVATVGNLPRQIPREGSQWIPFASFQTFKMAAQIKFKEALGAAASMDATPLS